MSRFMSCADCGEAMVRNAKSLPPGLARCHGCRRVRRGKPAKARRTYAKPAKPKDYAYKKTLTCADCGEAMWNSPTSKPQGAARCLPCRRARPVHAPKQPPKKYGPPRICSDCGLPCWGIRCQACAPKDKTRIRADDDSRTQRWQREQAAPGIPYQERRKLLRLWVSRRRQCAYCSALATTIDHVVPLVRGGTNHEGNLVPCCKWCNSSKGGLTLVEWRTGKRLGQMRDVLPWVPMKERAPRKPKPIKPPRPMECIACGAPNSRRRSSYCHDRCRSRTAYRLKVGIPASMPAYGARAPKVAQVQEEGPPVWPHVVDVAA